MKDDFDIYLSTAFKNMAARYPIPKGGRERLLRAAVSPSTLDERPNRIPFFDLLVRYFAPQTHDYQFVSPIDEVFGKTFSNAQIWSWGFVSAWRM